MWTADWGQLLPHVLQGCAAHRTQVLSLTHTHRHAHVNSDHRKQQEVVTGSYTLIVSFFHLRSSRMNSRSITNCTQREQDEKNNLESRGRAGGEQGAAPRPAARGLQHPCTTTTRPKEHQERNHTLIKFVRGHSWFVSDIPFKVNLISIRLWLMINIKSTELVPTLFYQKKADDNGFSATS